jgi:REP element-mobilizing transposase RayT
VKYIKQLDAFYDHVSVLSYVIMPNHVHLLVSFSKDGRQEDGQSRTPVPTAVSRANSAYSQFVSTFKRFCNKEIGGNIWQSRSFDHRIRDRRDYEEHLRYIQENPIKWAYDELYADGS